MHRGLTFGNSKKKTAPNFVVLPICYGVVTLILKFWIIFTLFFNNSNNSDKNVRKSNCVQTVKNILI